MNNSEELRQQLHSINRKSYPAYKALKGVYHFGNYLLSIDHVQGDPFASPSHVSVFWRWHHLPVPPHHQLPQADN